MFTSLGYIIGGSLNEGLLMRLNAPDSTLYVGKFVCIKTPLVQFFSLITDIQLNVTHPDILLFPPTEKDILLHNYIQKKDVYVTALVRPLLMVTGNQKSPVKTIPPHFSAVYEAQRNDIVTIFGQEEEHSHRYFSLGSPLGMNVPVCIDLEKLTERSTGIFGKTGTGKTFITRILVSGLIHHQTAVTIIFDTHGEYGLQARRESEGHNFVKGLKTLFGNRVALFSLDPLSTRRRGGNPDVVMSLSYESIAIEDILSLQEELNLHTTACEAAYLIGARYKKKWLKALFENKDRLKEFSSEIGAHPESIAALYRKLRHIERLPFFTSEGGLPIFEHMMEYVNRGISIVIEFGNFSSTFCYLLLANIVTRHIHQLYVRKTEQFLGSHAPQDEPQKLLIVVEEAHKFLNPHAARQTIFGTIAREMRKYYVSLLIVDQRPSGIDSEILSQLGTKLIAQLNDERDIQAVLTGVANPQQMRSLLSSLDSKKHILAMGHALAMPIVLETRSYDEEFYKSVHQKNDRETAKKYREELF